MKCLKCGNDEGMILLATDCMVPPHLKSLMGCQFDGTFHAVVDGQIADVTEELQSYSDEPLWTPSVTKESIRIQRLSEMHEKDWARLREFEAAAKERI